jgi:hypothetical protein
MSTVHTGLLLERATLNCFKKLGFCLKRVGGRNDKGVDLRGTLQFLDLQKPVIIQYTLKNLSEGVKMKKSQ